MLAHTCHLCFYRPKFAHRLTKVPDLLKGRSRHDIRFRLALIFSRHAPVILNGVKELRSSKADFYFFNEGTSPAEGQVSA